MLATFLVDPLVSKVAGRIAPTCIAEAKKEAHSTDTATGCPLCFYIKKEFWLTQKAMGATK